MYGHLFLSVPVLYPVFTSGIDPIDCAFNAGNLAGSTLKASGEFNDDLSSIFVEGIKMPRADK